MNALRWMPPVAPARWEGVRSAQGFGHACAQAGRFYSPAPNDAPYGLSVRDSSAPNGRKKWPKIRRTPTQAQPALRRVM